VRHSVRAINDHFREGQSRRGCSFPTGAEMRRRLPPPRTTGFRPRRQIQKRGHRRHHKPGVVVPRFALRATHGECCLRPACSTRDRLAVPSWIGTRGVVRRLCPYRMKLDSAGGAAAFSRMRERRGGGSRADGRSLLVRSGRGGSDRGDARSVAQSGSATFSAAERGSSVRGHSHQMPSCRDG
jgi:hypothetical protein